MQHTAPRQNAVSFAIRHFGKTALILGAALAMLTGAQAKTATTHMHVSAIVLPFCQMTTTGQTATLSVRCTAEQNYTVSATRGVSGPAMNAGASYSGSTTVSVPSTGNAQGIVTVSISY